MALLEPSSSDKWLASLRKSVSKALADFSRAATRGLLRILRSGSFSPNQARPGDLSRLSFVLHQHCMPARMAAVLPGALSVLCYLMYLMPWKSWPVWCLQMIHQSQPRVRWPRASGSLLPMSGMMKSCSMTWAGTGKQAHVQLKSCTCFSLCCQVYARTDSMFCMQQRL